jgi:hypothetical protein
MKWAVLTVIDDRASRTRINTCESMNGLSSLSVTALAQFQSICICSVRRDRTEVNSFFGDDIDLAFCHRPYERGDPLSPLALRGEVSSAKRHF